MKRYIIRRLIWGIIILWFVSIVVFVGARLGGDPILMMVETSASQEYIDALRARYGLDKPLPVQYLLFVMRAVKGDFGESIYHGVPASEIIRRRLLPTLQLVGAAKFISLLIGLIAGILAAVSRKKAISNLVRIFSLLGLSIPNFWIALLAILVFSVYLQILPVSGAGGMEHLIMPAFALGWSFSAGYTRLVHSSLLEVLNLEYIKLARIKGLPEWLIVGKHALKNAIIPLVTLAGINVVIMISAAVAVETVFAWPGLGFLLYQSALFRDFNVVQGVVLLTSCLMVLVNLFVDILYAYLDPRIRYT